MLESIYQHTRHIPQFHRLESFSARQWFQITLQNFRHFMEPDLPFHYSQEPCSYSAWSAKNNRSWRPIGLWDVEAPIFSTQSAYRWRRQPFTPRKISGTHFCWRLSRLQGHNSAGRIRSIEISDNLVGNRTRDLPACSILPQSITLPRAPDEHCSTLKICVLLNCLLFPAFCQLLGC
jgi:hypothetical protein